MIRRSMTSLASVTSWHVGLTPRRSPNTSPRFDLHSRLRQRVAAADAEDSGAGVCGPGEADVASGGHASRPPAKARRAESRLLGDDSLPSSASSGAARVGAGG